MKQQNSQINNFDNQTLLFKMFIEQSDNCQLIIGKINIITKKQISPLELFLKIKGVYKIWDLPKKDSQQSYQSHIDFSQTLSEFQNVQTKRRQKGNLYNKSNQNLQREQIFMQGEQKISQIDQNKFLAPDIQIIYPFIFNIPTNMPPTEQAIYFANKRIQIKYFLSIKGKQNQKKNEIFNKQFEIKIRQHKPKIEKVSKLCKVLQYRCYTRCFCACLGTYHLELNATILHPGKIQIQGRLFREGKTAQNVINSLQIFLYGELKKVKKMLICQKKMVMRQSDYQMYEGQVLLGYDPQLRTFESQLMTIRFWVQCQLQFYARIWKFEKKNITTDIIL